MNKGIMIGTYVRTNEGYIGKLLKIKDIYRDYPRTQLVGYNYVFDGQMWDSRNTDGYYDNRELTETEIDDITTRPSFDIIDLIKVGDYVNGCKVITAGYNEFDQWCVTVCGRNCEKEYIYPGDIKTILTKEQYEAMAYEVK